MHRYLIPVLFLALAAGCSTVNIGPHRIDVQQGNALDQENVARLKPGLNRSQVRFLLGTPLVVDPFRTDRWDYVYVLYKAGRLAEQKRITLFFEGDTLARIEGDMPEPAALTPAAPPPVPNPAATPVPVTPPQALAAPVAVPVAVLPEAAPVRTPTAAVPVPKAPASPAGAQPSSVTTPAAVKPEPVVARAAPAVAPTPAAPVPAAMPKPVQAAPASSIVPPLPSPKNAPAYVDPHPPAEPALRAETDVERILPDVIPPFPEPGRAAPSDDAVLKAVNDWANAWAARDDEKYLAAYDAGFVPQGGGNRADWERRRRLLLGVAKNIELKVDSPSVERADDGSATVTFNQFYRSDSYRDAVVKQLHLVERGGRWLIVEEKVLSTLHGARP